MTHSVFIAGDDVAYIHRSGCTKENAERIAALLNDIYAQNTNVRATVIPDEEAERELRKYNERSYFVVLEDGCVVFIEITREMRETIDNSYDGDEEAYFAEVVCGKYNISYNNCQWSITCESCIACYGRIPKI